MKNHDSIYVSGTTPAYISNTSLITSSLNVCIFKFNTNNRIDRFPLNFLKNQQVHLLHHDDHVDPSLL